MGRTLPMNISTPGPSLDLQGATSPLFSFEEESGGDEGCLKFTRKGEGYAPHWTTPLAGIELRNAVRVFRTGLGFSGPSNFVPLPRDGTLFSYESYLITAFVDEAGRALVLYTKDHRRFLAKTEIYNRVHRHEFRNRRVISAPVFVDVGFSTEGIPIPAEGLDLPWIYFLRSESVWDGVSEAAVRIADYNEARVSKKPPRYFCSWYHKFAEFSESDLHEVIEGFENESVSMDSIQIDDGYAPAWGDWLEPRHSLAAEAATRTSGPFRDESDPPCAAEAATRTSGPFRDEGEHTCAAEDATRTSGPFRDEPQSRWPSGMEEAAKAIRACGARAGIWVAPFAVEEGSRLWQAHPDWVLRDLEGEPILKMSSGAYEVLTHGDRYALDASHPDVRAYIGHVFRTLYAWGYRLFKTDFMDWGYADSAEVQRHTPGKTSAMWFDECLQIIREAIGEESYWLACISYFQPFVGYCEGMRVSSDVGPVWNGDGGTGNDGVGGGLMNVLQETYHDQFFNRVFWNNDPDVIFLRETETQLNEAESRALALWSAMLGGSVTCSDSIQSLSPRRRQLWEEVVALHRLPGCAMVPYWGEDLPVYVLVRRNDEGPFAVLILNPGESKRSGALPLKTLIGFEKGKLCCPDEEGEVSMVYKISYELFPHECRLVWLAGSEQ